MEKDDIKYLLREAADDAETTVSQDYSANSDADSKRATPSEYERVRSLLDNDKINHAGVVKQLWGSKDATKRSLFRKKLNQMNNESGGTYEFNKDEISKIMSILMNFSNEISSKLKPSKNVKNKTVSRGEVQ